MRRRAGGAVRPPARGPAAARGTGRTDRREGRSHRGRLEGRRRRRQQPGAGDLLASPAARGARSRRPVHRDRAKARVSFRRRRHADRAARDRRRPRGAARPSPRGRRGAIRHRELRGRSGAPRSSCLRGGTRLGAGPCPRPHRPGKRLRYAVRDDACRSGAGSRVTRPGGPSRARGVPPRSRIERGLGDTGFRPRTSRRPARCPRRGKTRRRPRTRQLAPSLPACLCRVGRRAASLGPSHARHPAGLPPGALAGRDRLCGAPGARRGRARVAGRPRSAGSIVRGRLAVQRTGPALAAWPPSSRAWG